MLLSRARSVLSESLLVCNPGIRDAVDEILSAMEKVAGEFVEVAEQQ
jgi:hypothetical protein